MWTKWAGLAVLGILGTWARYALGGWIGYQRGFPAGTLVINALGSCLIGFVYVLAEERFFCSAARRRGDRLGRLHGRVHHIFDLRIQETGQLLRDGECGCSQAATFC